MNPNIEIRAYSKTDQVHVLDLLKLNTPDFFSEDEEKDLIYYLENEIEQYFVLEFDQTIIGCGGINFAGNHTIGRISWDILHPKYQRKGFGGLLLNYRIDILRSIKSIQTISVRTSQLAYKFYEKSGFDLIEVNKNFWAEGFDLYKMELKNETLLEIGAKY
jgi:ribosomal-protein-alanine N-acetyltransferase